MSDQYLDNKGNVAFIEGTDDGKSRRIFKPIGFFGPITVYEEQASQAPASPPPPVTPGAEKWDC